MLHEGTLGRAWLSACLTNRALFFSDAMLLLLFLAGDEDDIVGILLPKLVSFQNSLFTSLGLHLVLFHLPQSKTEHPALSTSIAW